MTDFNANASPRPWQDIPMGPAVRTYLGLAEQSIGATPPPTATEEELTMLSEVISQRIIDHSDDHSPENPDQATDLVENLTAMGLAPVAMRLFDSYRESFDASDFRTLIALGTAGMDMNDLGRAELFFRDAQELMPQEPAPYTNLAQILLAAQRDSEAETWILAGLDAEPNNRKLWQLLFEALAPQHLEGSHDLANRIRQEADQRGSWAGLTLYGELLSPGDAGRQVLLLEPLLATLVDDAEYLVEFTGVLGAAGLMERIPTIIWQAERRAPKGTLSWQLYLHAAQAHLSLGQYDLFRTAVQKVESDPSAPLSLKDHLEALKQELSTSTDPQLNA